jgi:type I restriction enzyme S subunit
MNAQQLKNSILQEAIEGRLVPQDPYDEPASVLLDIIRKEKARLVKEGKLKKKDLEEKPISEDEKPFEIPESWEWVRWGALGEYKKGPFGSSLTKSMFVPKSDKAIKVYEQKNAIQKDYSLGEYYISEQKYGEMKGFTIHPGDIIVSCAGTIGETYLLPKEAPLGIINQALMRAKIHLDSIIPYWLLYFKYILVIENKLKGAGSAIKNIPPFEVLKAMPVALPPLAEQKRIVAKIEELLPKVEEYGKAQESLDKLNEELPEKLKKSILQEAIEGRLVPQDPNDEPASVLLDKIRAEKKQLVKEGKLKKKDLEVKPISEDEIPFEIPESWEWTRLGAHISATSGLAYKKDDLAIYSNEYIRVLRGGNIFFGSWSIKDDDVMIGKQFVNEELILKKGMFISPAVTSLEHMGKTALIREDQKNVVAGGFVLMLIPHYNNETYWEYLNILFQSGYYREKCKSITNKSGQAFFNLSRAKLLDLLIPVPPLAEQQRIVAKIEQLMKEIDKLKV